MGSGEGVTSGSWRDCLAPPVLARRGRQIPRRDIRDICRGDGGITLSRIRLYNPHVMSSGRISPSSARGILSSRSFHFSLLLFSSPFSAKGWDAGSDVETSQCRRDRDRSKEVLRRKCRNRRRGRSTSAV